MGALRAGLYESLLTAGLDRQLTHTNDLDAVVSAVDPAEQPNMLARHIRDAVFRALSAHCDPAKRVELVSAMWACSISSSTGRAEIPGSLYH